MKTKKLLALLVSVLALSGCVTPNPSSPVESNQPSDSTSENQFVAVSVDVVKSSYTNNQATQVEGVVYGITTNGFFVADSASAGIFVNMGDNWTATVKLGSKVQIDAKYSLVSGYCMLKQATVTVVSEGATIPVTAAEKPLTFVNDLVASPAGDYGMFVKLVGTLTQDGSNYVLTDDEGNSVSFANSSAGHLATAINTRVTLEAIVYKKDSSGKWQMVFAGDENDIVNSELTFADYLELAKADIAAVVPATCTGNLVLPAAHSVDSTLTYTWAVKTGTSVTIVENQAVVVPPTADEEVVLTVTITKGENTETVEVPVLSKAVVEKTVAQFMSDLPVSGDAVKVNGVVVAMGRNQGSTSEPYAASKRYVIIQDETTTDSVPVNYFYSSTDYAFEGLSIGDKVTVEGNWSFEKGDTNNPTINADSVTLVSENTTVVDAKESAVVISTQEQYEDLGENPDNYVGKLLKFDNPYLIYSNKETGLNPSNWVKFGYDDTVAKVGDRSVATLIGLGNENVDLGWDKHFAIPYSDGQATQFAGDIYAYLVYRSGTYLQLCIPSASHIALEAADRQIAFEQVCALPDSIDSEGQLTLDPAVTYTFGDTIIGADGKVGVAVANQDVAVTVTKGDYSFTKNITVISATTYALTVGAETNGATTLSKTTQLLENEEVKATFAPAQGYTAISYTVTTDAGSVKYPAYGKTEVTIAVPGNATVTADYIETDKIAAFNYAEGRSVAYYYVNGEFKNSGGDKTYDYDYVMDSIRNKEGDNIDSSIFGVEPITTFADGKWCNFFDSSDRIALFSDKDSGAYSGFTMTSKHKIHSITITYQSGTYVARAAVQANGTDLVSVIEGEAVRTYMVDGNSFSITNISGGSYLYMKSINIVYEAPGAHEYEFDNDSHWLNCSACDGSIADTPHELVDGECVCGYAAEKVTNVGTTDLYALYKELYGTDFVKSANDKGLVPADTTTLSWLNVEGEVQLRTGDSVPKLEIMKNETGALSYTTTGKVRITVQIASTAKDNSSSFALKAGDAYLACDQDATALVGTIASKTIVGPDGAAPIAQTLYELSGTDNVYLIYGSGDGITLTWTVDASAVEGGLKLALTSPDAGCGRGVRVLAVTIDQLG